MPRHTTDTKTLPPRATTSPTRPKAGGADRRVLYPDIFSTGKNVNISSHFPGSMCPHGAPPTGRVRKGQLERTLPTDMLTPVGAPSLRTQTLTQIRVRELSPPHAIQVTLGPHPPGGAGL